MNKVFLFNSFFNFSTHKNSNIFFQDVRLAHNLCKERTLPNVRVAH